MMFDVVLDYLLFLVDVKLFVVYDEEGNVIELIVGDDKLFVVLVFKIVIDLFVGCLIFLWVYIGFFKFGFYVLNVIKGKCEWIGCLF